LADHVQSYWRSEAALWQSGSLKRLWLVVILALHQAAGGEGLALWGDAEGVEKASWPMMKLWTPVFAMDHGVVCSPRLDSRGRQRSLFCNLRPATCDCCKPLLQWLCGEGQGWLAARRREAAG